MTISEGAQSEERTPKTRQKFNNLGTVKTSVYLSDVSAPEPLMMHVPLR